jgi:hypothetical protein
VSSTCNRTCTDTMYYVYITQTCCINSYFMVLDEFCFCSNCRRGSNFQECIGILTGTLTTLNATFQVLTAAGMKMAALWVVVPCSLVEVYGRFRGDCCFHHQGDHPDCTPLRNNPEDSHLHTEC